MLTVIIRLITLHAENVIPEVIWAMAIIYLVATVVTLTSVWVTYKGTGGKLFWLLLVVLVPFIGIMAHCLRCLTLADIDTLKQFGFFSRKTIA